MSDAVVLQTVPVTDPSVAGEPAGDPLADLDRRADARHVADPDHPADPGSAETDRPVAELVQRLHSGELDVRRLPVEVRRQCVEQLTLDGFTTGEIAQLLRLSERTVRQDREAGRRAGALAPSLTLGDELLGEFERLAQTSAQRLARLARDPSAPPYARLWAEEAIVRIHQRFIDTAHRLGCLDDGAARLARQRDADPERRDPVQAQLRAMSRRILGLS